MKDRAIIFFTRIPLMGETKTRLEPFLSPELCVDIQKRFIEDIYGKIKNMGIDIVINYSDNGELSVLSDIIGEDVYYLEQEGKDLGEKMYNGINTCLKQYRKVVLIGSDIPLINEEDFELAFEILDRKDIVISPTYDGGYYLIGMKKADKSIFEIKYSTNSVYRETIDAIEESGKTYGQGNIQLDIDDEEDFLELYKILLEDEDIACEKTREFVMDIMRKRD